MYSVDDVSVTEVLVSAHINHNGVFMVEQPRCFTRCNLLHLAQSVAQFTTASITGTTISDNYALLGGGALYALGNGVTNQLAVTIIDSTITGNDVEVGGGAIKIMTWDSSTHPTNTGNKVYNNVLFGGKEIPETEKDAAILIGGTTAYDPSDDALTPDFDADLLAILAEWTSDNDYDTRVGHLMGTIPGGANGSVPAACASAHAVTTSSYIGSPAAPGSLVRSSTASALTVFGSALMKCSAENGRYSRTLIMPTFSP